MNQLVASSVITSAITGRREWTPITKPAMHAAPCSSHCYVALPNPALAPGVRPYKDCRRRAYDSPENYQSKKCSITVIAFIALKINPDSAPKTIAGHSFRDQSIGTMEQYAMQKHRHVRTLGSVAASINNTSNTSGGLVLVLPAARNTTTSQITTTEIATARLVK